MTTAARCGLAAAAVYAAVAIAIVAHERRNTPGSWLDGLVSAIATFPVSWLGELLGHRPDHRSDLEMAIAIGGTAILVYAAALGIGAVIDRLAG